MVTVAEIFEQAKALSQRERKELVKWLVDTFDAEKTHSILEFEGMAAHLADDEDPQDYVNRTRSEWDERP
jgi:hypothetical protein